MDPICRVTTPCIKMVCDINQIFPFCKMQKSEARSIINARWNCCAWNPKYRNYKDFFESSYQPYAQMALYYESNEEFIPRFSKFLSYEEIEDYIKKWFSIYYSPNPYSKAREESLKPIVISKYINNYLIKNGGSCSFTRCLESMFGKDVGNSDILQSVINYFSPFSIDEDVISFKKGEESTTLFDENELYVNCDSDDKEFFFKHFDSVYKHSSIQSVLSSPDSIRSRFIKFWSLTDQHGATYEEYVTAFENLLNPILAEECGISSVFEITDAAQYKDVLQRIVSKHGELEKFMKDTAPNGDKAYSTSKKYSVFLKVLACTNGVTKKHRLCGDFSKESTDLFPYLTAIRTKPFILLAGISGTGKSRIVRKLAQATDTIGTYTDDAARFACHKPENFCLIQVKPNWHNSMDVVGYKSNVGTPNYVCTEFIKFIAKAWKHPDVPFFLCLDEMNLAPVEEYFAEFLSAIESRSIDADGNYETDPIVRPFKEFGEDVCKQMIENLLGTNPDAVLEERFKTKGLTLPKNLIVMGTVNMDETTFSFSRKVLDRAMSIEMNEVDYDAFLDGSTEMDVPVLVNDNQLLIERAIKAQEVKDNIDAEAVKDFLNSVNNVLEGTPFKLGYRAANEAMLYVSAAKDFGNDNLAAALDEFTLMKILSRIEGDDSKLRTMLGDDLLEELKTLFLGGPLGTLPSSKTLAKLDQMIKSLERDHFVSFWG